MTGITCWDNPYLIAHGITQTTFLKRTNVGKGTEGN